MHTADASDSFPDLVLTLRRDGTIVSWSGGDALPELRERLASGKGMAEAAQEALRRLARRCIATRTALDGHLDDGIECDVRATPQGPDRVVCTIRSALRKATDDTPDETGVRRRPGLERRGFTRKLRDRLADASLRERPLAIAVIQIDGLPGLAQSLGARLADRVMNAALQAIPPPAREGAQGEELLGQLGDHIIALVVDGTDRSLIQARIAAVCEALRTPHVVEGVRYKLESWAGVALTGVDRATPTQLLDQASAAALEARLAGMSEPRFHSDTVRVRALDRLDIVHELREAVERREFGLRFLPRHDLQTGGLNAHMAYLHWPHRLRGAVRPAEFLNIAEGTGIGAELSKGALRMSCAHFQQNQGKLMPHVRVSFGPLRDHVLESSFVDDVLASLDEHGVPPDRFEVRIAERTFVVRELSGLGALTERGVRLVIDEVGRNVSSLGNFARAPLWGLQLDRSWAAAPASDFGARAVCRAVSALAAAFGFEALATGVDDARRREVLGGLGYRYGSGDLFAAVGA